MNTTPLLNEARKKLEAARARSALAAKAAQTARLSANAAKEKIKHARKLAKAAKKAARKAEDQAEQALETLEQAQGRLEKLEKRARKMNANNRCPPSLRWKGKQRHKIESVQKARERFQPRLSGVPRSRSRKNLPAHVWSLGKTRRRNQCPRFCLLNQPAAWPVCRGMPCHRHQTRRQFDLEEPFVPVAVRCGLRVRLKIPVASQMPGRHEYLAPDFFKWCFGRDLIG